jgi:hypothetical protein
LREIVMILELKREGLGVSAIARQTGLDRKTVRKYLERGLEAPVYGQREPGERLATHRKPVPIARRAASLPTAPVDAPVARRPLAFAPALLGNFDPAFTEGLALGPAAAAVAARSRIRSRCLALVAIERRASRAQSPIACRTARSNSGETLYIPDVRTTDPSCPRRPKTLSPCNGAVAEWSKAHAWKVCRRGTVSRVRIPLAPPLALAKAFSRSGCGRIFPLFSGVMRVELSTDSGAGWLGSGLSGPIFSGPVNCASFGEFL